MSDEALHSGSAPGLSPVPDRADAPVSEVTERFLRAVIAEIPLDRIEELHLFSPLRQGTLETGIAVLAARAEPVAQADGDGEDESEPELPFEDAVVAVEAEVAEGADVAAAAEVDTDVADISVADATGIPDEAVEAGTLPEGQGAGTDLDTGIGTEISTEAATPAARPERHTVYTARYRYIIKGPERGKWEANVKAEADAPLLTVETVVRGVQRRAGEGSEIVRYSAHQIARALRLAPG